MELSKVAPFCFCGLNSWMRKIEEGQTPGHHVVCSLVFQIFVYVCCGGLGVGSETISLVFQTCRDVWCVGIHLRFHPSVLGTTCQPPPQQPTNKNAQPKNKILTQRPGMCERVWNPFLIGCKLFFLCFILERERENKTLDGWKETQNWNDLCFRVCASNLDDF